LEWNGRVLALGDWGSYRSRLGELKNWAQDLKRPIVGVYASSSVDKKQLMADLATTLRRFAQVGGHPVVYVMQAPADQLETLRDQYKPVVVRHDSAGKDGVMRLWAPSGEQVLLDGELTRSLFEQADQLPGVPSGHEQPAVVTDWLWLTDWPAREAYLRAHSAELVTPEVASRLAHLPEARPYAVLLDLVTRNGGLSDPATPRYAPAGPISLVDLEPDFQLTDPLPETFVFDYLGRKSSLEERKAWNDRLLRLAMKDGLSPREMVVLAGSVDEAAAVPNAVVFEAVGKVLDMPPAEADRLASRVVQEITAPNEDSSKAIDELLGLLPLRAGTGVSGKLAEPLKAPCQLAPYDKAAWVYRMLELHQWLKEAGKQQQAALVDLQIQRLSNCYG
jgi:hypothetical protein